MSRKTPPTTGSIRAKSVAPERSTAADLVSDRLQCKSAGGLHGGLVRCSCPGLDQVERFFRMTLATWTWPDSTDAPSVLSPSRMICLI